MDENILADLFVANDNFDELERALNIFCPFEAVGMVSQEIRHGKFLSYLFDPNRPHGFGTDCLAALMRAATRTQHQLGLNMSLLDVHLMDFQSAIVRPEWNRIDILIEVPDQKLIVAIELKINAKEHSQQLSRYRAAVQKEWPDSKYLFLFLTKNGDDPSEDDGGGWQTIELGDLASELAVVAGRATGDTLAREMLSAYLAMLGRHHLDDDRLEGLATNLWAKHRGALEFLADRRPDAVGDLFKRIVDGGVSLAQQIHAQCGEPVIVDYSRRASVYFAVPAWDSVSEFACAEGFTPSNRILLLEVTKAGADYFRCYFLIGRGDQKMREKLFFQLKNEGADVGKKNQPTKEWNRLASFRISLKNLEDQDLDALAGRVFTQIRDFAAKHIPVYTKALTPLMKDSPHSSINV